MLMFIQMFHYTLETFFSQNEKSFSKMGLNFRIIAPSSPPAPDKNKIEECAALRYLHVKWRHFWVIMSLQVT
jgi:hypothetical protein